MKGQLMTSRCVRFLSFILINRPNHLFIFDKSTLDTSRKQIPDEHYTILSYFQKLVMVSWHHHILLNSLLFQIFHHHNCQMVTTTNIKGQKFLWQWPLNAYDAHPHQHQYINTNLKEGGENKGRDYDSDPPVPVPVLEDRIGFLLGTDKDMSWHTCAECYLPPTMSLLNKGLDMGE